MASDSKSNGDNMFDGVIDGVVDVEYQVMLWSKKLKTYEEHINEVIRLRQFVVEGLSEMSSLVEKAEHAFQRSNFEMLVEVMDDVNVCVDLSRGCVRDAKLIEENALNQEWYIKDSKFASEEFKLMESYMEITESNSSYVSSLLKSFKCTNQRLSLKRSCNSRKNDTC